MPKSGSGCWVVAQSALASWNNGRVEITSAVSGITLQAEHSGILHVLHAFAPGRSVDEVVRRLPEYAPEQVVACVDELIKARILISASEEDPLTAHQWERSALAFHRKSRQPALQAGRSHDTVAVVAPRSAGTIALEHPPLRDNRDLAHVLEARRSTRTWPERAIARETFSRFFWMSARNRHGALDERGHGYVNRPYPSGGASYSLEIYPVIAPGAVKALPAGMYRYLPDCHGLETLTEEAAICFHVREAAARAARTNSPPIVIVIASRLARQSEVYGDLAYSLVLKEVGALFQTFYLVAEYLDLAACALGTGVRDDLLAELRNASELAEPAVGEFMIGPR